MDMQTVVGAVLALGGVLWAGWSWVKAKAPKAADLVEDVIERLRGEDAVKAPPVPPTRMEALESVEALMRYMEQNGNKEGAEALVVIVREILVKRK